MGISIVEFEKAVRSLEEAIELHDGAKSDSERKAFRDAAIQRFEFSIELSWKISMKVLGSTTAAAKIAIREMARNNLIDNPVAWIKFIEDRNETSHSYDELVAQKVYSVIVDFLPHAKKLILKLNENNK